MQLLMCQSRVSLVDKKYRFVSICLGINLFSEAICRVETAQVNEQIFRLIIIRCAALPGIVLLDEG